MIKKIDSGDVWGGLAAMLVAFPAAIAFGVSVYAVMGKEFTAAGAISAIIGVVVLGIVAVLMRSTHRLITAPSAPAAAALATFASSYIALGYSGEIVVSAILLVIVLAGLFQILFGLLGFGKLIQYLPYSVSSGFLSGVGLYIIASQSPILFGIDGGFLDIFGSFSEFKYQSIVIGIATIVMMLFGYRLSSKVPSVLIAIVGAMGVYFTLSLIDSSLLIADNELVIGRLGGDGDYGFDNMIFGRFDTIFMIDFELSVMVLSNAIALAALLSVDTLKSCVILDSMTHTFHNPNRELIAQGCANVISSMVGGMAGSGTIGATLVNIASGGKSRISLIISSFAAVVAFIALGGVMAWIPLASLAAVLVVIGFRMIDIKSLMLFKSQKTFSDFIIVISVALSTLIVGLMNAILIGLVLALVIYMMQQFRVSIIYSHKIGSEIDSKVMRSKEEREILARKIDKLSIYELQGNLFFGTVYQLYAQLKEDLLDKKYIVIDFKRVQLVDLSGVNILFLMRDIFVEKNGILILTRLPYKLPSGDDLERFFKQIELFSKRGEFLYFDDLDYAMEWIEEDILRSSNFAKNSTLLEIEEFDIFKGRSDDTMIKITQLLEEVSFSAGDVIYKAGEGEGELFLIRRGKVSLSMQRGVKNIHLSTLSRNNFFGEFSFLDSSEHYTTATAKSDVDLYKITRRDFDSFAKNHYRASQQFMQILAYELAYRLRNTRVELEN